MLAATHRIGGIAFGAVLPLAIQKYMNIELENQIVFVALTMSGGALGSLIPDIDSTSSTLGRKIKPLSKFISNKFGHRGGTHTLVACLIFTIFCFIFSSKFKIYLSKDVNIEKFLILSTISTIITVTSCLFILDRIPSKLRGILSKKNDIYIVVFLTLATMIFTFKNTLVIISYIDIYIIGVISGYISHIFLDLFTKEGVPLLRPITKYRFSLLPFKTGSFIEGIFKFINTIIIFAALIKLLI
ncbi:MAG: metal-dependent hydrolase [Sarcina sp.]